ncbi:MAG: response regulator transcription factor [Lachnospiraceae bacterium]|nr:response regulator transcription factor [Lachnospiraceae bacterium]
MNSKATILIVEDDPSVQNLMATTLRTHDYSYLTAGNGETAIMQAASHNPDVIFLDLGLPDMDGVDVIKNIRTWSELPIIVISARSDETDKIEALDAGADDYLTKPFSVEELLARLRVSLRRLALLKNRTNPSPVFHNGEITIDFAAETATLSGQELHLTPIEYKLLTLLARNEGKVLTYSYITKEIWGSASGSEMASLRVFMAALRKKLEPSANSPQYIQTHVGIGYRMLKVDAEQG